jgi:hypothetical protein
MRSANLIPALNNQTMALLERDSEEGPWRKDRHPLDEIQRRACRIHHRHGAIYGGYTLEEWLEAEHELEDENKRTPQDRIH